MLNGDYKERNEGDSVCCISCCDEIRDFCRFVQEIDKCTIGFWDFYGTFVKSVYKSTQSLAWSNSHFQSKKKTCEMHIGSKTNDKQCIAKRFNGKIEMLCSCNNVVFIVRKDSLKGSIFDGDFQCSSAMLQWCWWCCNNHCWCQHKIRGFCTSTSMSQKSSLDKKLIVSSTIKFDGHFFDCDFNETSDRTLF